MILEHMANYNFKIVEVSVSYWYKYYTENIILNFLMTALLVIYNISMCKYFMCI